MSVFHQMSFFRKYLLATSVMFVPWGISMIYSAWIDPDFNWYAFPAYHIVREILPIGWWGVFVTLLGLSFAYKFVVTRNRTKKSRYVTTICGSAAAVSSIWMISLFITLLHNVNSPLGPLLFMFCTAVHIFATTLPIQDLDIEAFESLIKQLKEHA